MTPRRTEQGVAFAWPDSRGPWEVEPIVAYLGGRPELVGLSIRLREGAAVPLTSKVLKRLQIPKLVAGYLRFVRYQEHLDAEDMKLQLGGVELSDEHENQLLLHIHRTHQPETLGLIGRPAHWTAERLAEVAQTYRKAYEARKPPTAAVADRFDVSLSWAAKLVQLARQQGLLGQTTPGKAGWRQAAKRKQRDRTKEGNRR